mmetsp:Transcript_14864/g.29996  ORF Transcript_14864/g.29996 Transcript_14864/m.29996 type:complete len:99 (-) Transcript_14864:418-714(-)
MALRSSHKTDPKEQKNKFCKPVRNLQNSKNICLPISIPSIDTFLLTISLPDLSVEMQTILCPSEPDRKQTSHADGSQKGDTARRHLLVWSKTWKGTPD